LPVSRLLRRALELEPFPQPPILRMRHPVMLMHGFGAIANLMQGGVLNREALHLRERGVWAYAPHVDPYNPIAERAGTWKERLARVFEETRAEKVHLIGFSSGGLDARHLAADPDWAGRIASIVAVSTPHLGSPLADFIHAHPRAVLGPMHAVMDWMGRAAYEHAIPDVVRSLGELSTDYMTGTFAPAHPEPDGIFCASVTGRAGRGAEAPIFPPLWPLHEIVYRAVGANDGFVPVASGRAFGEFWGCIEADHAAQIGMRIRGGRFDASRFYLSICGKLAERERAA
jgi:triacylglycerol lipase